MENKRKKRGANLLEYILIAALITAAVWGAVNLLGTNVAGFFNRLATWVANRTGNLPNN